MEIPSFFAGEGYMRPYSLVVANTGECVNNIFPFQWHMDDNVSRKYPSQKTLLCSHPFLRCMHVTLPYGLSAGATAVTL